MTDLIRSLQSGVNFALEDKFEEAIKRFDEVIEFYHPMVQALIQRGRSHWEMKRWATAQEDFKKAHAMAPSNPEIPWTMSLMYLQMRDFEKGWATFDGRWNSKKFDSPKLKTPHPQWEPLRGYKDTLVWSEQGVGDQILYCSLLRTLKSMVPVLTVMIDARLVPLFKRSFGDIDFIPQNAKVYEIDSQIPMGSVAKALVPTIHDIDKVRSDPYLIPDYARASAIRNSLGLAQGERLVGLSWISGAPIIGNHKSISLEELLPVLQTPNTRFVTLQYGDHYKDIYELEKKHGVRIEVVLDVDNTQDLDGLAALICACDAVVTVSNVTGHIAGAVGTRTFLLDSNKLWYWNSCEGNRNLWYPSVTTYQRDSAVAPWRIDNLHVDLVGYLTNEKPTFVFFRTGTSEQLRHTQKFVKSLRISNPHAEIIMCTDSKTPIVEGVTKRFELDLNTEEYMWYRVKIFAHLNLKSPAIYLDDDMIVHAEMFPKAMLGNNDVMLCRRSFNNNAIFNTSMKNQDFSEHAGRTMESVYPYLACATATRDGSFWNQLLQVMEHIHPKYRTWYGDQEAMRIWASMSSGWGTIMESEYACLPEHSKGNERATHYKGSRKEQMR